MFADFPEEGNGNEEGQEEVEGEELDEDDEEAQRLEQFMRMQLHFRNRNGNNEDDEEDTNGDGHPGELSFTPEPGQFDDVQRFEVAVIGGVNGLLYGINNFCIVLLL